MKGKADLVLGWLKRAASDLPGYHSLFKPVARCVETEAAFEKLSKEAGLLTPFAVEARYDPEFWPTPQIVEEAKLAADRIRTFVCSLIQSSQDSTILYEWGKARDSFNWRVDLRRYKDGRKHPGFFDRVIEPAETSQFEDAFRAEVVPNGAVQRAAEVVYWKNAGNFKARDRITRDLLVWIDSPEHWARFVEALKKIAHQPTWGSFRDLIDCCGQTSAFATPLTFLAFYDPWRFPMIDRRIGTWWLSRFPAEPQFTWNSTKTVISPTQKSFQAYLRWTEFCRKQAAELSKLSATPWRARDVEMAVWSDVEAKLPLA